MPKFARKLDTDVSTSEAPTVRKQKPKRSRIVTFGGQIEFVLQGLLYPWWKDLYHWLITMSWPIFLALVVAGYGVVNSLFAMLYVWGGDCIANAQVGAFWDAFFFSVQTMATIGYGAMYPKTPYANALVAIEALVGMVSVAMGTGLMFARFSRPTARVIFSRNVLVKQHNGQPVLMFRTANQRGNQILEARLWVTLVRDERSLEGEEMRRIHDLNLLRDRTPFFALSWTAIHPLDDHSPLRDMTPDWLIASNTLIQITLTGTDETLGQTVHARHNYTAEQVLWNYRFVDIFCRASDGRHYINYDRFHDVCPLE